MSDADLVHRYISPDGSLVFRIERAPDGVVSFGFEGQAWHLHPEFFEADGRDDLQIARDVADDLINDRSVILTERWPGGQEMRILDSLETLVDFHRPDESLEFRFWGGRRVSIEELIDQRVAWNPLGDKIGLR